MIIYDAMKSGQTGTTSNQYATSDPALAKSATDYMSQWTASNPSGFDSDRAMMDYDIQNGTNKYSTYQASRKAAYDAWLAQRAPTTTQTPAGSAQAAPTMQTMAAPAGSQSGILGAQMGTTQPGSPLAPNLNPNQVNAQYPINTGANGSPNSTQVGGNINAEGQITSVDGYNAAQLGDPTRWEVTQDQTMQGQLQGILGRNSGLMENAREKALQQMNDRGLVNSSIAVQAGQQALYDTALPIAQNDANTMANAAGYNADIKNKFEVQNKGWLNEASQFNADARNVAGRTNATNRTNLLSQRETNANQLLIGRERNQTDIQTNKLNNETTRWTASLDADVRREDIGMRRELGHADIGVRRELGYLDATVRREDIGVRKELGYLDAAVRREDIGVRRDLGFADIGVRRELGYLDSNTRQNIANLDANTRLQVTEMEGEYRNLLQSNQNAASMFSNMAAQIAAIDQSNLSVQGKVDSTRRQQMLTRDALATIGAVGGVPNLQNYYNYDWYSYV